MDGLTLLRRARLAGLRVTVRNGKLVVRGPRNREAVALELLAHKAEVVRALMRSSSDSWQDDCSLTADLFGVRTLDDLVAMGPVARARGQCFACGGNALWRLRGGGDWICTSCHPPQPRRADIEVWEPEASPDV